MALADIVVIEVVGRGDLTQPLAKGRVTYGIRR